MMRRLGSQLLVSLCWTILLFPPQAPAQPTGGANSGLARTVAIKSFLEEELQFDRYVFPPGRFPVARWRRPEVVEHSVGSFPLTFEYFDSSFVRVTEAATPGRYGAVVHGTTPDGFHVVRYVTLYCSE